jgi:hypothetical protein
MKFNHANIDQKTFYGERLQKMAKTLTFSDDANCFTRQVGNQQLPLCPLVIVPQNGRTFVCKNLQTRTIQKKLVQSPPL